MATEYQYFIVWPGAPIQTHRGPWTLDECWEWLNEFRRMPVVRGAEIGFRIARREVGPLELVDPS